MEVSAEEAFDRIGLKGRSKKELKHYDSLHGQSVLEVNSVIQSRVMELRLINGSLDGMESVARQQSELTFIVLLLKAIYLAAHLLAMPPAAVSSVASDPSVLVLKIHFPDIRASVHAHGSAEVTHILSAVEENVWPSLVSHVDM